MRVTYHTIPEDFNLLADFLWRFARQQQKEEHYKTAFWYFAVLGATIYVAIRAEEVLAACILSVMALFYVFENWSFSAAWRKRLRGFAEASTPSATELLLDDGGVTESYLGYSQHIPWEHIREYRLRGDRLFICYFRSRGLVVPTRDLPAAVVEELIGHFRGRKVAEAAEPAATDNPDSAQ